MSEDEKQKQKEEYEELLALFITFLKSVHTDDQEEALYALSELRANLAISHAFKGFNIDEEEALLLLKNLNDDSLTQHDKDSRDRLIAAVNNLIDFAVCEEYQMAQKAIELYDENADEFDGDYYNIDWDDPDEVEEYYAICGLYNDTYASVENSDIEYAMGVAYKWIGIAGTEYLTYWTMNDAKVRPWHMELQGYTARRDEFPSWMIPPIEYNCRCFLESLSGVEVMGRADQIRKVKDKMPAKPKQLSDVYSESVATCGRIFGASHPYFQVAESDKEMLQDFVERIKTKYYG